MDQPKRQFKNLDGISGPKQQVVDLKNSKLVEEQIVKPTQVQPPPPYQKQKKWQPRDLGIFFASNIFAPIKKHPVWSVSYLFLGSALAVTLFIIFQPVQALEPVKEIPEIYTEPLVVSLGEDTLSLRPVSGRKVEVKQEGNRYIYEEAYKYTDVVQTNYPYKIKEELIFSRLGHPIVFEYQLGNLDNFIVEKDSDGNIIFHNKEQYLDNGGPSPLSRIFTIPTPFVEDRTKLRSFSAVDTTLNQDTGLLRIAIDNGWLSNVQYPVTLDPTIEINILNVHSHPQLGDDWVVDFTTRGTEDLYIIPDDQATIDDDEFTSLSCDGEERIPQILDGDVIYYPDWRCDGIGQVVHYTKKAGTHTLRFEFGGQVAYAHNAAALEFYSNYISANNKAESSAYSTNSTTTVDRSGEAGSKYFYVIAHINTAQNGTGLSPQARLIQDETIILGESDVLTYAGQASQGGAYGFTYNWVTRVNLDNSKHDFEIQTAGGVDATNYIRMYNSDIVVLEESAGAQYASSSPEFCTTSNTGWTDALTLNVTPGTTKDYMFIWSAETKSEDESDTGVEGVQFINTTDSVTYASEGWGEMVGVANDNKYYTVGGVAYESIENSSHDFKIQIDGDGTADETCGRRMRIVAIPFEDFANVYTDSQTTVSKTTGLVYTTTTVELASQSITDGADHLVLAGVEISNENSAYTGYWKLNGPFDPIARGMDDRDSDAAEYYINFLNYGFTATTDNGSFGILGNANSDSTQREWAIDNAYMIVAEIPAAGGNADPTITDIVDNPDPVSLGSSISFPFDWNDADAGDFIKAKLCSSNSLTNQNCDGTTYASSSVFTTDDVETLTYQTQESDGSTLTWWGFVCDDEAACSAGTSGNTTISTIVPSGVKLKSGTIKLRSGEWKINLDDLKHLLYMSFLAPFAFMIRKKE